MCNLIGFAGSTDHDEKHPPPAPTSHATSSRRHALIPDVPHAIISLHDEAPDPEHGVVVSIPSVGTRLVLRRNRHEANNADSRVSRRGRLQLRRLRRRFVAVRESRDHLGSAVFEFEVGERRAAALARYGAFVAVDVQVHVLLGCGVGDDFEPEALARFALVGPFERGYVLVDGEFDFSGHVRRICEGGRRVVGVIGIGDEVLKVGLLCVPEERSHGFNALTEPKDHVTSVGPVVVPA